MQTFFRHLSGAATLALAAVAAMAQGTSATDLTDGEVRRIDQAGGRLTLKHGEIRNLDMPPMTMVFQVRDPAVLQRLKVGDRLRFRAVQEGGTFVVTDVEPPR